MVAAWQEYRGLFPVIPERSRFNRRRRAFQYALNDLRRAVLALLDRAQDRQCVIDSLPVPVLHFHLVPESPSISTWRRGLREGVQQEADDFWLQAAPAGHLGRRDPGLRAGPRERS